MEVLKRIKSNSKLFGFLVGCTILLLSLIGVTFARYAYKEIRNYYLESKNFYFNSDKLGASMTYYQVDNWSGVDDYVITFNMNSYKNNLVFANSDISYEISYSCSDLISCTITKTSGIIYASNHTDSFSITLSPDSAFNDGDIVWVEVTAKATSPYTKVLKGKFAVKVGKMGLSYEIEDEVNRPYLEVNVTNTLDFYTVREAFSSYSVGDKIDIDTYLNLSEEDKMHCISSIVTIQFDPEVIFLDMTNSAYLNALSYKTKLLSDNFPYIYELSFKIDALSSSVVKLYKNNTALDYSYPFVNSTSIVAVSYS